MIVYHSGSSEPARSLRKQNGTARLYTLCVTCVDQMPTFDAAFAACIASGIAAHCGMTRAPLLNPLVRFEQNRTAAHLNTSASAQLVSLDVDIHLLRGKGPRRIDALYATVE